MAHNEMTKEQQQLLAQLEAGCKMAEEKAESTSSGWVVVGHTADGVNYCYCGDGKGYEGAPLRPACLWAVVFESEEDAIKKGKQLIGYRNGAGQEIKMDYMAAWYYFEQLHEEQKRCVEMAKKIIEQINNK